MGFVGTIVMISVNVIFLLAGIAVMTFGIIAITSPITIINGLSMIPGFSDIQYLINIEEIIMNSAIFLTVVGSVIVAITLVGLIGNIICTKVLTAVYVGLVLTLLLFELAVIIYASVSYNTLEGRVQTYMFSSLQQYFKPVNITDSGHVELQTDPGALAWETLQFEYGCCGAYNYTDFTKFQWNQTFSYRDAIVPPSCCIENIQYHVATDVEQFVNLTACMSSAPLLTNTKGCYGPMLENISQQAHITIIVIASLIALEVIVLMISMHLIGDARKSSVSA